ncbi:MAG: hypothetical protein ACU0AY_10165 [Marinibacterium profundimaris]
MTTHFMTYGTAAFTDRARNLADSASAVGFDTIHVLSARDLADSAFAQRNAATLSAPRGAGYWLWKPYLIRRLLSRLGQGDVLVYSDAGRDDYYRFSRFPERLVASLRATRQGFVAGTTIGHLGDIGTWTKRDCLVLMQADDPETLRQPMVQSTWSLWTPSRAALAFLDAWLELCQDPRCLTDQDNVLGQDNREGFIDHRHDQSICSILAHRMRAPVLDFSRTVVHRVLERRPRSALGGLFYKRLENCDDLMGCDTPWLLMREYMRLRHRA